MQTRYIFPLAENVKSFSIDPYAFVAAVPESGVTTAAPVISAKAEGKVRSEESEGYGICSLINLPKSTTQSALFGKHGNKGLFFQKNILDGSWRDDSVAQDTAAPRDPMPTSRLQQHLHSQAQTHTQAHA